MIRKPKGITAKLRAAKKRKADAELKTNAAIVRERDRYCRYCDCGRDLEVHHIQPRSLGVDHSTGNLVLLCADDHAAIHGKRLFITGNADGHLTFSEAP